MDILSLVTRVPILVFGVERNDDDFADRLNYKYTVAVLVIFAIMVTNRQFGTKQIHCWIPAYFTRNYEEYINDICWVSNTYYISLDQKLPEHDQIRKSFELKYYQWVPFILLSQAFFFYIPHIAWRALSRRSGIDVRDIVEAASNYKSVDKYETRQKYMSYMLTAVDQYVDDPRRRKESRRMLLVKRFVSAMCCISGKFLGNYLMVLYFFVKLAFIANCLSQLFVLNLLLGHEFHKFGFELMDKIWRGKGWDTGSRIFPKISMCDFKIREVGNPKVSHRYTVQCVLPINLFNQQIFTFIWFWYALVLCINIYSLCVWTYRFLPTKRERYIARRIEIMRQALFWRNKNPLNFEATAAQAADLQMHEFERDLIRHFVHDYLESDGLFILRVLSANTSDFVCTELIQELWKYYRKQRKFNRVDDYENDDDDDDDDDVEADDDNNKINSNKNIKIANGERGDPKKKSNQEDNVVIMKKDMNLQRNTNKTNMQRQQLQRRDQTGLVSSSREQRQQMNNDSNNRDSKKNQIKHKEDEEEDNDNEDYDKEEEDYDDEDEDDDEEYESENDAQDENKENLVLNEKKHSHSPPNKPIETTTNKLHIEQQQQQHKQTETGIQTHTPTKSSSPPLKTHQHLQHPHNPLHPPPNPHRLMGPMFDQNTNVHLLPLLNQAKSPPPSMLHTISPSPPPNHTTLTNIIGEQLAHVISHAIPHNHHHNHSSNKSKHLLTNTNNSKLRQTVSHDPTTLTPNVDNTHLLIQPSLEQVHDEDKDNYDDEQKQKKLQRINTNTKSAKRITTTTKTSSQSSSSSPSTTPTNKSNITLNPNEQRQHASILVASYNSNENKDNNENNNNSKNKSVKYVETET